MNLIEWPRLAKGRLKQRTEPWVVVWAANLHRQHSPEQEQQAECLLGLPQKDNEKQGNLSTEKRKAENKAEATCPVILSFLRAWSGKTCSAFWSDVLTALWAMNQNRDRLQSGKLWGDYRHNQGSYGETTIATISWQRDHALSDGEAVHTRGFTEGWISHLCCWNAATPDYTLKGGVLVSVFQVRLLELRGSTVTHRVTQSGHADATPSEFFLKGWCSWWHNHDFQETQCQFSWEEWWDQR